MINASPLRAPKLARGQRNTGSKVIRDRPIANACPIFCRSQFPMSTLQVNLVFSSPT
jgi:hypothetical protein